MMIAVNLKSLIQKLNATCRSELENAAGYALLKTHYDVELEHWLKKLLLNEQSDIPLIFNAFGVNTSEVNISLDKIIDKLKVGNSRAPGLAPNIVELIKQTWLVSTIEMNSGLIRSGHILITALAEEKFRLSEISPELGKIQSDRLRAEFKKITENSSENNLSSSSLSDTTQQTFSPDNKPGEALNQFTIDLVAEAKAGKIDPILGRGEEIRQIIDILSRRRQNNPILAGEAGVGRRGGLRPARRRGRRARAGRGGGQAQGAGQLAAWEVWPLARQLRRREGPGNGCVQHQV